MCGVRSVDPLSITITSYASAKKCKRWIERKHRAISRSPFKTGITKDTKGLPTLFILTLPAIQVSLHTIQHKLTQSCECGETLEARLKKHCRISQQPPSLDLAQYCSVQILPRYSWPCPGGKSMGFASTVEAMGLANLAPRGKFGPRGVQKSPSRPGASL